MVLICLTLLRKNELKPYFRKILQAITKMLREQYFIDHGLSIVSSSIKAFNVSTELLIPLMLLIGFINNLVDYFRMTFCSH